MSKILIVIVEVLMKTLKYGGKLQNEKENGLMMMIGIMNLKGLKKEKRKSIL